MDHTLPLGGLNVFGYQVINTIELVLPFNWAVAIISAIACMTAVYVMGQIYRWSWRLLIAGLACALALNVATPLITPQPPWVSAFFLSLANFACLLAVAIKLHKEKLL